MFDRRQFLAGSTQLALLSTLPALARSQHAADSRFVFVILRGGLDGLAAVPPLGDPSYANVRGSLAIVSREALTLDGMFGLHPALENMHGFYQDGELAVLHAVATPYRERSHFDGQNVLENGATSPGALIDGWLNRAAGLDAVHGRRRAQLRLDLLRAAVDYLRTTQRHLFHLCHSPGRHQLDHGRDQHHRHHSQPARPRHDADENAAVRLDLADHRLPADCGNAGIGRGGDHDADGHSLRYQLLQRRWWR